MEKQNPIPTAGTNEKQVEKPKKIVIFNKIDITKAVNVAKRTKPVKKTEKVKEVKVSKNYEQGVISIFEDTVIEVADNSIKRFIKECHPDVQSFISHNEASKIVVYAGGLVITTKNGFRIKIHQVGAYRRRVTITDKKRKTLFNDITIATILKNSPDKPNQVVNNKNNNHSKQGRN